jgi:hypothetical protein
MDSLQMSYICFALYLLGDPRVFAREIAQMRRKTDAFEEAARGNPGRMLRRMHGYANT